MESPGSGQCSVMIEYEGENETYSCTISGVFLVDLGVDGEVILKWILRK